ncbi:MAG TPA: hypothetical protein DCG54_08510 [Anaerolineae bacterium]|jgi:hypothetical protein|nr:hypothetical protein [Anaerolineae bacterium]
MKYLTLFSLEIVHGYYADQRCADFQIEPTPATRKLLDDCRCVLKPLPNGARVLVSVNDKNFPFVSLPTNPVFVFHLKLQNTDFSLFTDLTEISQMAAPLYTNTSPATEGDLTLVAQKAWGSEQFIVQQPGSSEAFSLGGRPLENLKAAGFSAQGLGVKSGLKSYDSGTRVVTVNSAAASPGTPFTVSYPITPRLERDVFADVEIKYDSASTALSGSANTFRVVFSPREARWKYYIVTEKTDNKAALPALEDKDKAIAFNAADRTDLTITPDPADEIALKLAEQYPNKQYFRFVSSAPVTCQKAARKNIQLQFDGEKVIDTLANPSLQNYSIDVRNSTKEYSLYQIVKYFIQ